MVNELPLLVVIPAKERVREFYRQSFSRHPGGKPGSIALPHQIYPDW
jgi:hypothetical protein